MSYELVTDHDTTRTSVDYADGGPTGSAVLTYHLRNYVILSSLADPCCSVGPGDPNRDQGADGIPCTLDDPALRATTVTSPAIATTGQATGGILRFNGVDKEVRLVAGGGHEVDCNELLTNPLGGLDGLVMVGAFTALAEPLFGDVILEFRLACEAATIGSPTPSCGPPTPTPVFSLPTETPSATPSNSAAPTSTTESTPTNPPPPTATPSSPLVDCVGDCNGDGQSSIDELVKGVNIALGNQPASACPAFENAQGTVDIAQLVKGVNNVLNGCGRG